MVKTTSTCQPLNYYVFQDENLHIGALECIHTSRLTFYSDRSLKKDAIIAHVLFSETEMLLATLRPLERRLMALKWQCAIRVYRVLRRRLSRLSRYMKMFHKF